MPSTGDDTERWVEPGTNITYPLSYWAYRRTREAQEKSPARHCTLGPEVDRYVWRRWRGPAASELDVVLTLPARGITRAFSASGVRCYGPSAVASRRATLSAGWPGGSGFVMRMRGPS